MSWFTFRQNNSGGYWDGPIWVFVEADTAEEANERAVADGPVYFNGAGEAGPDCPCCGSRWHECRPHDGYPTPSEYGEPLDDTNDTEERLFLRKET